MREQAERISRCRLTFHVARRGVIHPVNQNIVDMAMFVDGMDLPMDKEACSLRQRVLARPFSSS